MNPNLADFLTFIRVEMGISTTYLPDDSPAITMAYNVAIEIVNPIINVLSPTMYTLAVYNLAGDNVINFAQDQTGQTFFADLRKSWNLIGFVGGIIQYTADESTSQSMAVPDSAKMFTLANLQQLKTPYGRQYLQIAQSYGYNWGLS